MTTGLFSTHGQTLYQLIGFDTNATIGLKWVGCRIVTDIWIELAQEGSGECKGCVPMEVGDAPVIEDTVALVKESAPLGSGRDGQIDPG